MSFVAYTPASYVFGLFLTFVLLLAGFGFLVGSFLADMVKARVMLVASVVYWVVALLNWLYGYLFYYYHQGLYQSAVFSSVSSGLFWSMIVVLCADVTYMVKYFVKKRRTQS